MTDDTTTCRRRSCDTETDADAAYCSRRCASLAGHRRRPRTASEREAAAHRAQERRHRIISGRGGRR